MQTRRELLRHLAAAATATPVAEDFLPAGLEETGSAHPAKPSHRALAQPATERASMRGVRVCSFVGQLWRAIGRSLLTVVLS